MDCLNSLFLIIAIICNALANADLYERDFQKRQSTTCDCCWKNRQTRIVGGQDATPHENPSMVMIWAIIAGNSYEQMCGGTLIDKNYVLTAAHCVIGSNPKKAVDLRVECGAQDLSKSNAGTFYQVSWLIGHPLYSNKTHVNDIAILKLAKPVTFDNNVRPICLPTPGKLPVLDGKNITVFGWGVTEPTGRYSDILQKANVPVISQTKCASIYANKADAAIDKSNFCAGMPDGSKDACQGDSGGPAIYYDSCPVLVGCVSLGVSCASSTYPGVYTNVTSFYQWIYDNTRPDGELCQYPSPTPAQPDCGWSPSPRTKRIVGGSLASANEFPWMVAIYKKITVNNNPTWSYICGGTLISSTCVITTAKCVNGTPVSDLLVVLGDYDLNVLNEPGEQTPALSSVTVHPSYNTPYLANDIAIIKLVTSIIFNKYIFPICLPSTLNVPANYGNTTKVLVTGWGRTSTNGEFSGKLKEVNLWAINNTVCRAYYGTVIQDSMMCTNGGTTDDICDGDFGDPVMGQGRSNRFYLVASASTRPSDGCASGKPAIHTRMTSYLTWIKQVCGVDPYYISGDTLK